MLFRSQRLGLARCILTSIAVIAAMLLLLPAIPNVHAWFPIRFLLGAGATTLFIATETWVNAVAAEESRGRTIGVFGLLWAAGFAAGPLVIRATGIEGWPPVLASIGLVALAAAPLLGALDLVPAIPARTAPAMRTLFSRVPGAIYAALSEPDTALRLFGKPEVNGQRRMGVALARDESIDAARAKATRASQAVVVEL